MWKGYIMKAFIFPGQGSQKVGMGQDLYNNFTEAKEVFEEVNDALNFNLSKIIFEGDEQELKLTANTQPSLMTVSYAVVKVIELMSEKKISEIGKFVAGHSLGEYSALLSVNAIPLSETAKILRLRGRLMQESVPVGIGSMAALIGANIEIISEMKEKYLKDGEILDIGNDNSPGQIVISGNKTAVDRVVKNYKEFKIKRAIELPVSAPFHCALMEQVSISMEDPIKELSMIEPEVSVINNVDAEIVSDPEKIKQNLIRQICGTVKWRESIQKLISMEVSEFIELGSGSVLSGLVKRIDKESNSYAVEKIEDIENFVNNSLG